MGECTPAPLLAGALRGFALGDVLQLLELGARSGILVVDGGPLGGGSVRLCGGRVVAVTSERAAVAAPGDHATAIAALLELPTGQWAFHAVEDAAAELASGPERGADGVRVTAILVEVARRRDERSRDAVHPSRPDAEIPHLAHGAGQGEAPGAAGRLMAADLHVLATIDGVRDVEAIAAATRRDVVHLREVLRTLRALGVVCPHQTHVCAERGE